MSLSSIPKALRDRIAKRDAGRCGYCGLKQLGQAALFHIDHVIPRSKGGATVEENLVLQCPNCSLRKGAKIRGLDPVSGVEVALYHPLRQRWDDHFVLLADGKCVGKSAIGRATSEALQFNSSLPTLARSLQIEMKLLTLALPAG